MLKYKLPPIDKEEQDEPKTAINNDEWRRRITIPVNDEILQALQVGDTVTIELTGKVTTLNSNESEESQEKNITIMVTQVCCDSEGESDRGSAAMKKGYQEG